VKGNFGDFSGTFAFDEKSGTITDAKAAIKAASINTGVEDRDKHLRSPEFLDVEKYPEITFAIKSVKKLAGSGLRATGDITIHGVTKPIELEGEFLGTVKDPWGNNRAGFTATGKLNRGDFGLKWNKVLESGGLVVGEEVKISLEFEGIMQK
jgi:polyisoprenoid-binding protein YceI